MLPTRASNPSAVDRTLLRIRGSTLHAHLGCDRAGVAHLVVVIDLVSGLETIEVAGQQRVAVEIKQAALFGEQESEIFLGVTSAIWPSDWFSVSWSPALVRPSRCSLRSSSRRSA